MTSSDRGFTLVELMIVVLILGVLAALATIYFTEQLDKGRTTKLKELAMEVEKGQKAYASRNGTYFTPNNKIYSKGSDEWEELLEFSPDSISSDTRVMTQAGTANNTKCKICPKKAKVSPDTSENWYAIKVCRNMGGATKTGTDCTTDTFVYLDNNRAQPMVFNQGK